MPRVGPGGNPLVGGGGSGTAGITMGSIRGIGITTHYLKIFSARCLCEDML